MGIAVRVICFLFLSFFNIYTVASYSLYTGSLNLQSKTFFIPKLIKTKISKNERIIFYTSDDLNGDGLQDIILVTENLIENKKYGVSRKLFIFFQQKHGNFQLVLKNNNVIACSKCSNFTPSTDPFSEKRIAIRDGEISITQYFDMRFNTSLAIYNFKYDGNSRKFVTTKAVHVLFKLNRNPNSPEDYYQEISDETNKFGKTLDVFNPKWHNLTHILDDSYSD